MSLRFVQTHTVVVFPHRTVFVVHVCMKARLSYPVIYIFPPLSLPLTHTHRLLICYVY